MRFLRWRTIAGLAVQLVILAVLLGAFFVRAPQVSGPSMEPNIQSGEYVVIDTLAYRFGAPKRGDIVAFAHGVDPSELLIKRVIGLPGDRISIDRGRVFVNGIHLHEPYVHSLDTRTFQTVTVPRACVFVLGDNRAKSEDSRFFGPVSDATLTGEALAGIWPPARIGKL